MLHANAGSTPGENSVGVRRLQHAGSTPGGQQIQAGTPTSAIGLLSSSAASSYGTTPNPLSAAGTDKNANAYASLNESDGGRIGARMYQDKGEWRRFGVILLLFEAAMLVLFALFVRYPADFALGDDVQYMFLMNVTVMVLVGFGFLMSFMRHFGLGAVGLTMLLAALCIPWCIITGRFFASVAGNTGEGYHIGARTGGARWGHIELDVNALLQGNFAAAAVLISFGAVIGKASPSQVVLMAIAEVPLYSINKELLCIGLLGTLDMGGTLFIHLFGAYFGLAIAWTLGAPGEASADAAEPNRVSDVLSLLGTAFLWIYWPSFNGATAPLGQSQQLLTTVNTVVALCGSCLAAFIASALCHGRSGLNPADIQNATLAGGVAIGAASNLQIGPALALLVGSLAGALSVVGFSYVQGMLKRRLHLHDSCGVHNLHGMPAMLGSFVVAIAVADPATRGTVVYPRGDAQCWAQLGGAMLTLGFALCSGLATGRLIKVVLPSNDRVPLFRDDAFWLVANKKADD